MGHQSDPRPWPYSVGARGVNRVRVYSRSDSAIAQVEWWDDRGRQQRSLRTVTGEPVLENTRSGRTLARDIAERMSAAQAAKRHALSERRLFGGDSEMTLGDLLGALHGHRAPDWKPSYKRDQERFRKFWLEALGEDRPILRVNAALVERIARDHAAENGWSKATHRHYLRYLTEAYSFAHEKLKEIDERHTLSAVNLPKLRKGRGRAYTVEETRKLLPALWTVDPRAGIVGEAYYQAGRRLNSTRLLEAKDVRFGTLPTQKGDVEASIITYPGKTDKAKEGSEAVLVGDRVLEGLRDLLNRPAVRRTGLLCPHGDLDDPGAKKKPIRKEPLIDDMLQAAEEAAGIEHQSGRAYHGIKRRFSGSSAKNRETAAKQSGTTVDTLRDSYDPDDDLASKADLAVELVSALEEGR
jgi:hypothetical protein